MKQMGKWMALLCALSLVMGLFAGCGNGAGDPPPPESIAQDREESGGDTAGEGSGDYWAGPEDQVGIDVNVAALNGPTGMGMVGLMEVKGSSNRYNFTLAGSPDEVTPKIISGEVDIAAVPANLAAVLYNRTEGGVTLLAVNTLGVLYLVTKDAQIHGVEDLKNQTIYATGQGATPEYTLNHILAENGLEVGEDVTVEYKSEHAELAALILAGEAPVAMLPEPFVTSVTQKDESVEIAVDLTEEWEKATGGLRMPTGVIIVRNEFLEENPNAVKSFLMEYKASANYVNQNVDEAAALIGTYEIAAEEVAREAIPRCNIVFLDGEDMKAAVEAYYQVLADANPQSVGGSLPDDSFYYLD